MTSRLAVFSSDVILAVFSTKRKDRVDRRWFERFVLFYDFRYIEDAKIHFSNQGIIYVLFFC